MPDDTGGRPEGVPDRAGRVGAYTQPVATAARPVEPVEPWRMNGPDRRHQADQGARAAAQQRALALAARHINASTPRAIPEDVLLGALQTGCVPPGFEHHLFAFFDETDLATVADLVISGAVGYGQLAALADRLLRPGHATRTWLDARRSF